MVRYFPNNYPDYKAGESTIIDVAKITSCIDDHVKNITQKTPSKRNVEGGLYIGITGISYTFYYLSKKPMLEKLKGYYLEKAFEYLKPALETTAGDRTSFLLGDCGTYALAAILFSFEDKQKSLEFVNDYKSLYNIFLKKNFLKWGADEFFVGRTGYLAGVLWMNKELNTSVLTADEMYMLCDVIIQSGREYASQHKSPAPLMYHYYNTEYLGAAHGLCFILQMLLTVPGYLEHNATAAKDVKSTLNYLVTLQTDEGNWPCSNQEVGTNDHMLIHWCHGAPGVIYLMAKAYLTYKDEVYLNCCVKAADLIWAKGLLRKGPGICHGIAGNGYAFLLMHRLTGNEKYLHRAKAFADFMTTDMFIQDARIPDYPESLYEGTAGTLCFLADILTPDEAEFPFQDVFHSY